MAGLHQPTGFVPTGWRANWEVQSSVASVAQWQSSAFVKRGSQVQVLSEALVFQIDHSSINEQSLTA